MIQKFCVLMAVYSQDDPVLFNRALTSVYSNSLLPAQVVLVQDGPVGIAISDVITIFQNMPGFELIQLDQNRGLAFALNEGLKHLRHEYVFRADSDDINLFDRFEKQLPLIANGLDLLGSSVLEVDRQSKPLAIRMPPLDPCHIRSFLKWRNPFNHMTVVFRLSAVTRAGGYPIIHLKEDYALWATMISKGAICSNMPDVLVHACAGIDMYKRRGGIKYVRSEIAIQKLLIKLRLQTLFGGAIVGLLRSVVFLIPASFRGFIYENLLRKRAF